MTPRTLIAGAIRGDAEAARKVTALRERERLRIARLGRRRFGAAWDRLDPRLREAYLRTPR